MGTRKHYEDDFKEQAVRHVLAEGLDLSLSALFKLAEKESKSKARKRS